MKSYTNLDGQVVKVSEQHLKTAVKVKQALQSQSPSMLCSWAKHKKMMMAEGFEDSENSENYRQMIKRYQYSMDNNKEVDLEVASVESLKSVETAIGELAWRKRDIQKEAQKLGQLRRSIVDNALFTAEIKDAICETLSGIDFSTISPAPSTQAVDNGKKNRLIAVVSDWHIGALVDVDGNKYNLEIAKNRINQYLDNVINAGLAIGVEQVDVVYCGDILEHAYMRNSQAYHAEFPVAKQMAIGGRLMVELIMKLKKRFARVSYRGFAGNHDRINGDKNGNIDGDTGMIVVNEIVQMFIETAEKEGLEYIQADTFGASLLDVNGRNFKFVHGDLEKKNDTKKLADHSERDGVIYDAIVYGHFHHFNALEVGVDKWEIRCGSTKGSDDYSKRLGLGSAPSQVMILITPNGDIEPCRIRLN